jgi:hypothetical protein
VARAKAIAEAGFLVTSSGGLRVFPQDEREAHTSESIIRTRGNLELEIMDIISPATRFHRSDNDVDVSKGVCF